MSLLLLLLLPALVGLVLVLLGPRADAAAAPAAAATSAVTLLLALSAGTQARFSPDFLLGQPFSLGMDGLSLALAVTVCVVTTCVLAAVPAQVAQRRARLCGWLLLFLSSVLLTLAARSLLPLLAGWELMGAASWLLIGHDLRSARAAASATTALLTTRALDLGLYLAAGAALAGSGSLELDALTRLDGWPLHAAALGIAAAALGKAAQLPVSFWLSRAMDGPSPVSALLHSAAMVAMGGYLLVRTAPVLASSGWADDVVAWTGVATAVLLGLVALAQRDLKQLLAASTASQLGFVVLAAGIGARGAGATHLVAHAAVKSLLFLAAGLWLHALGTKDLGRLRGAALRTPAVGLLAALGLASLGGLPPLALWGSKDSVLTAAEESSTPLYLAALVATGVSAAYAARALAVVLRHTAEPRVPVASRAWLPLVPLAVGAATLAVLVGSGIRSRFGALVGGDVEASLNGLVVSALLALAVAAAVWPVAEQLPDRLPAAAGSWLHLEGAAHLLAVRPVLALSRATAAFDDRVLDRGVEGAARTARGLSLRLAAFDDRAVDAAVEASGVGTLRLARGSAFVDEAGIDRAVVGGLARGFRRLGEAARRPQTGQLHQYYAQAAAVLVAATVLLLVVR